MQKLFRIKNTGFSLNIQSQVGLKDDDKFNEVSWTYSNINFWNINYVEAYVVIKVIN